MGCCSSSHQVIPVRKLLAGVALTLAVAACAPDPVARYSDGQQLGEPQPMTDACAVRASALSPEDVVGQLLMVGVDTAGLDSTTADAVRAARAGSVVLLGRSDVPASQIRALTAQLSTLGSAGLPLTVAADQEGGQVQRLRGPGFTRMPSAVAQGGMDPAALRAQAKVWGTELREHGVQLNLAPTADVVPEEAVGTNAPIGRLERHYSSDPARAGAAVASFVEGMREAGVGTTLKHFPGLGRATGNTDHEPASDAVTVRGDAYWGPFVEGISAGASAVMVSSAVFERIDPGSPAVFSRRVITGMLRDDLGFSGLVIADDLGAAKAVADLPPGERAVRFVRAGGDLIITADAKLARDMADALLAQRSDPEMAELITQAAARVLRMKESLGQLNCSAGVQPTSRPSG